METLLILLLLVPCENLPPRFLKISGKPFLIDHRVLITKRRTNNIRKGQGAQHRSKTKGKGLIQYFKNIFGGKKKGEDLEEVVCIGPVIAYDVAKFHGLENTVILGAHWMEEKVLRFSKHSVGIAEQKSSS
jgi:hypothetical protein